MDLVSFIGDPTEGPDFYKFVCFGVEWLHPYHRNEEVDVYKTITRVNHTTWLEFVSFGVAGAPPTDLISVRNDFVDFCC